MLPTNEDLNVLAKNVGQILVHLPLQARQARHEHLKGTLYYIEPKEASGGDKDFEEAWEFVKDLFEMKNKDLLKKWYSWHPFTRP